MGGAVRLGTENRIQKALRLLFSQPLRHITVSLVLMMLKQTNKQTNKKPSNAKHMCTESSLTMLLILNIYDSEFSLVSLLVVSASEMNNL